MRARGFTLIELLAVVLIFGLVAALLGPPLGLQRDRAVRDAAEALAASCELARQRAVMTGRDHRLVLDLDRGMHRVEWRPPASEEEPAAPDPDAPLPLSAPPAVAGDFEPIPGGAGRATRLQGGAALLEVELPDGAVQRGAVEILFDPSGTADPARVWVGDEDGIAHFELEVRPLADAVVLRRAEA